MLELDNVTFAWPGQPATYSFSLKLTPGEILGISGKSGSGKSTLLDLIAGFLQPQSGTIRYESRDLTALPPEKRPVSILFQSDNLFDHLSVGSNLALGLPQSDTGTNRTTRIEAALEEVGLKGFAARRASDLSGGQKQRTALARTLLRGKPVLLLDEPFTALDPEAAAQMRELVARLTRAHNWCVILVSHDQDDIDAIATRHLRVADNRLQEI